MSDQPEDDYYNVSIGLRPDGSPKPLWEKPKYFSGMLDFQKYACKAFADGVTVKLLRRTRVVATCLVLNKTTGDVSLS